MLLVPLVALGAIVALVPTLRPKLGFDEEHSSPAEASSASEPSRVAQVSGRIVDAEGEPVEGARVWMHRTGERPKVREATTAADGSFLFEQVPEGLFIVVAEHQEKGAVKSAELAISVGTQISDLVLALLSGHTVRGKIIDEDGQAIVGAEITIEGVPWLPRATRSGNEGEYALAHVPAGATGVRVTAPGFASSLARTKGAPEGGEEVVDVALRKEPDIEGIVLDPDGNPTRATVYACGGKIATHKTIANAEGRFRFPRELASCALMALHDQYAPSDEVTPSGQGTISLRLKAGGSIAGTVVDDGGVAITAFSVGIESFTPATGDREFSVRSGPAKSYEDPSGSFLLEKLAPGSYVLSVGTGGRPPVRSQSIEVRAGEAIKNLRIVLVRGGTVEGQVFDEEKHEPIANARVSFDATTSVRGEGGKPITTDAEGHYRLENAPSGPFSVRVDVEGFKSRIVSGLRVDGQQTLSQDIALKPAGDGGTGITFGGIGAVLGQTREGISFTVVYEGAPAEQAGVQKGDLLRRIDGESIEGMSVADAIQRLRGEAGAQVRVSVLRPGNGQQHELLITRAEISR